MEETGLAENALSLNMSRNTNKYSKIYSFCDWLCFLFGPCICDPPFAKTRLTAQTLRSAAEISANLAAKASPSLPGLTIFLLKSIINLPHAVFFFPSRFTLYQIKTARNSRFHQVKTAR